MRILVIGSGNLTHAASGAQERVQAFADWVKDKAEAGSIDEIADSMCDIATLQSKIHTLSRLLRRRALMDDAFRGTY